MSKRPIEPLPWLLFSAGGVAAALFLPVLLLLFGLVFPLGWVSEPSFDDVNAVLGNPLTLLVLFVVLALSLFHWAHRFRYTLYDGLQLKHLEVPISIFCYGGATIGSLVGAVLLWQAR